MYKKWKYGLFTVVEMWPFTFISDGSYGLFLPIAAAVTGLFVTFSLAKYLIGDIDVPVKDLSKHHNWKSAKILAKVILLYRRTHGSNISSLI